MSDINDWMEEHQGQVNYLGHISAINQRNNQIRQQREYAADLRKQTAALEEQNRIEQQRLEIESQRLAAEDADREMRRQQLEQVKALRNLISKATVSLGRFRKQHLA